MTRINAGVEPVELPSPLLLAEHREIVRIPNAITSGRANLLIPIPPEFTLGTGHVRFFYDKICYLYHRYASIYSACLERGFNAQNMATAFTRIPDNLWNDWQPTARERQLIIDRITSKGFSLKRISI